MREARCWQRLAGQGVRCFSYGVHRTCTDKTCHAHVYTVGGARQQCCAPPCMISCGAHIVRRRRTAAPAARCAGRTGAPLFVQGVATAHIAGRGSQVRVRVGVHWGSHLCRVSKGRLGAQAECGPMRMSDGHVGSFCFAAPARPSQDIQAGLARCACRRACEHVTLRLRQAVLWALGVAGALSPAQLVLRMCLCLYLCLV